MTFRFDPNRVTCLPPGVVVLGVNGMLGRAFRELLEENLFPFRGFTRQEVDLARPETLSALRAARPRLVINCAGWTDVDGAEANEDAADAVNGHGVGALAGACREIGATLVHFSTDYVFDGAAAVPYATDHPRRPINAYGRTKARGEELIEAEIARGLDALVLRTSWLYAPWGKNFVLTIANACRTQPFLRVVDDQRGRPTSAQHLARVSVALLTENARGIHHATDGGECTWFEFASEIVKRVRPGCSVKPCGSEEFPRQARRPGYSVLDIRGTETRVGIMSSWESALGSLELPGAPPG